MLGRMVGPDDVAAAVALAADPALAVATGSTPRVDAGWSVLVGGPASSKKSRPGYRLQGTETAARIHEPGR